MLDIVRAAHRATPRRLGHPLQITPNKGGQSEAPPHGSNNLNEALPRYTPPPDTRTHTHTHMFSPRATRENSSTARHATERTIRTSGQRLAPGSVSSARLMTVYAIELHQNKGANRES